MVCSAYIQQEKGTFFTMLNNNPILIRCKQCGSPTEFDVVTQNHNCQYCGATTTDKEGLKERNMWKREHQIKVSSQAEIAGDVFFSCGGCGAEVIVQRDKVIGKCEFVVVISSEDLMLNLIICQELLFHFSLLMMKLKHKLKWLEKNKRRPEPKSFKKTWIN